MQRQSGSGPRWKTGMEIVKQAQHSERQGQLIQAKLQYEQGLEEMLRAAKLEQDPASKQWMNQQIHTWLQHAEVVKQAISPAKPPARAIARTPSNPPRNPPRSAALPARHAASAAPAAPAGSSEPDAHLRALVENEIVDTCSAQSFEDIKGLENAKAALREAVVLPALRPDLYTGLRSAPRGLLVFGPPGNGKTMLARALANECSATFFSISASSLTSKWVGESEKLVRLLFEIARERQPSVIFMDEIDALLGAGGSGSNESSRRLLTEFLVQFDGVKSDSASSVFVMGATNRPEVLDEGVRRRLTKRIYIPLPCFEARRALIAGLLSGQRHSLSELNTDRIAEMLDGYSGSDITAVVKDAAMAPLRDLPFETLQSTMSDQLRPISLEDLVLSASAIRASSSPEELRRYELWNEQFGESAGVAERRATVSLDPRPTGGPTGVNSSSEPAGRPAGRVEQRAGGGVPVMRPEGQREVPRGQSRAVVKKKDSCAVM